MLQKGACYGLEMIIAFLGHRSGPGVVDKPLALYPGVLSLIPGSSSLLN